MWQGQPPESAIEVSETTNELVDYIIHYLCLLQWGVSSLAERGERR